MKLVFITVAASLLGGAIVAASTSADGQVTTKLQDRAPTAERVETVRVVDVSSCAPAPDTACGDHSASGPGPSRPPASFGPFGPEGPGAADHTTPL